MESILEQPSQCLPESRRLDSSSLHLLPCGIKHDGKANVSAFFIVTDNEGSAIVKSEAATVADNSETACTSTTESRATTPSAPQTSFRGRALKGTVVQVPPNYTGSIYTFVPSPPAQAKPVKATKTNIKEAMDMEQDDYEAMLQGLHEERKTWTTTAQFDSFMLWGHDHAPTVQTDRVMKALEWTNIAEILHEPVS
ncbi:Ribonuclease H2 subunit C [Actinomortierella wolfii]|nr:Ribonuclease H2 subunit C [Actinomortierella wolfii]